jgi:hypothetical protein
MDVVARWAVTVGWGAGRSPRPLPQRPRPHPASHRAATTGAGIPRMLRLPAIRRTAARCRGRRRCRRLRYREWDVEHDDVVGVVGSTMSRLPSWTALAHCRIGARRSTDVPIVGAVTAGQDAQTRGDVVASCGASRRVAAGRRAVGGKARRPRSRRTTSRGMCSGCCSTAGPPGTSEPGTRAAGPEEERAAGRRWAGGTAGGSPRPPRAADFWET